MRSIAEDLTYALRSLLKRPVFLIVTVLTLALGIGANTAIFSLLYSLVLRDPPYRDPQQLAVVRIVTSGQEQAGAGSRSWSYPSFRDVRERQSAFVDMAAFAERDFNLSSQDEEPERISAELVSASYFPLLGVSAELGRVFLPQEDATPSSHAVALISDGLWRRRFGASPAVLGRTLLLDSVQLTVVGVLPPTVHGLTGHAEVWTPMMMAPSLTFAKRLEQRFARWHKVIARYRPGVSRQQAESALTALLGQIQQLHPPPGPRRQVAAVVAALRDDRIDPAMARALVVLLAAVGLVLLIACLNVANLLLVRATSRQAETAMRVALGASRGRLVRLFLAESLILATLGGVAALAVASGGIRLAAAVSPVSRINLPFQNSIYAGDFASVRLTAWVLAANFGFALATGLLLAALPALQSTKVDLNSWMKQSRAGVSLRPRSLRRLHPMGLLVMAEVALSLVLLVGAGLLIRSLRQLYSTPLGFEPRDVLSLSLARPAKGFLASPWQVAHEQLLRQVSALPGVEAVGVADRLPLSGPGEVTTFSLQQQKLEEGSEPQVGVHVVSPAYFQALRIPLLRGRSFDDRDRQGAGRAALLNRTAVDRLLGGADPLGKRIRLGLGWNEGEYAEVVGVVGDVRYGRLEEEPGPEVYLPYLQNPDPAIYLVVRTAEAPEQLAPAVRRAALELDKKTPPFDVETMEQRLADAASRPRFSALLLSLFAVLACLLAAIGLYGVVAYSVSGRTAEIGVRLALGARPGGVAAMIVADSCWLVVAGLVAGIGLALAFSRVLAGAVVHLDALDPATLAGAVLLLTAVSLLASYLPARRALRIDPTIALRQE